MDIGVRIRFFRAVREVLQRDLAECAKMHPAQLCRYERGRSRPTLRVLGRIAKALNVPISEFYS
jgi:transcriptional regulator with XRE-family HTH domain